jgi:hypothetical protein
MDFRKSFKCSLGFFLYSAASQHFTSPLLLSDTVQTSTCCSFALSFLTLHLPYYLIPAFKVSQRLIYSFLRHFKTFLYIASQSFSIITKSQYPPPLPSQPSTPPPLPTNPSPQPPLPAHSAQTSNKSSSGLFLSFLRTCPPRRATSARLGFFYSLPYPSTHLAIAYSPDEHLLLVWAVFSVFHPIPHIYQPRRATSARLGHFHPLPSPPPTFLPNPAQTSVKRSSGLSINLSL